MRVKYFSVIYLIAMDNTYNTYNTSNANNVRNTINKIMVLCWYITCLKFCN